MQGLASRISAYKALAEHERSGAFLKEILPRFTAGLEPSDAAFARLISLGVVQHRSYLDYHLDALAQRGIPDARLRLILRIAAYQLLCLEGAAAHAIVNTAVEMVREILSQHYTGFANGLLKSLSRQGPRPMPGQSVSALAINFSHPEWLVKRWVEEIGITATQNALARNNQVPPIWFRVNPLAMNREKALEALGDLGVTSYPDPLAPLFLRCEGDLDKVLRSDLFASGVLSVQDPAAYFVAVLLQWRPPLSCIDLCAAPGGKAALLWEMALSENRASTGAMVCADISAKRLRSLQDIRLRLHHPEGEAQLQPVALDARNLPFKKKFDRVLIDAPCSNLGVIGRRPEARWRHNPTAFAEYGVRQSAILKAAADLVTPGGRMVYATCSPEPEETQAVVSQFLEAHPQFVLNPAESLLPEKLVRRGCLHLYPGETDYDGFFAAAFTRQPENRGNG